jgi:hypothetical protein
MTLRGISLIRSPHARAREAGRRDAARPARSAWSVQRQLAARFDGEAAGGAVAESTLVIFRFGATLELGRSGRAMMMPRRFGAARATGSASPRPDRQQLAGVLRRALSPTFPAGEMVFFIPWRVVAEESGAAHFGFGGAPLLDRLGPMVRPPAAPSPSPL